VTGSFSGKGKISCWKVFNDASEKTLTGLAALGTTDNPSELAQEAAELCAHCIFITQRSAKLVNCVVFQTKASTLSEKLPPTKAALQKVVLRAHYQAI